MKNPEIDILLDGGAIFDGIALQWGAENLLCGGDAASKKRQKEECMHSSTHEAKQSALAQIRIIPTQNGKDGKFKKVKKDEAFGDNDEYLLEAVVNDAMKEFDVLSKLTTEELMCEIRCQDYSTRFDQCQPKSYYWCHKHMVVSMSKYLLP